MFFGELRQLRIGGDFRPHPRRLVGRELTVEPCEKCLVLHHLKPPPSGVERSDRERGGSKPSRSANRASQPFRDSRSLPRESARRPRVARREAAPSLPSPVAARSTRPCLRADPRRRSPPPGAEL